MWGPRTLNADDDDDEYGFICSHAFERFCFTSNYASS